MMTTTTTIKPQPWPYLDLRRITLGEPGADGFRRSWIMLMPQGQFKHPQYGTLDFTEAKLNSYKRKFDGNVRGIEIALDQDHDKGKAPGWIEQMAVNPAGKAPGLYGLIRWTPLGVQLLTEQIYRYFSPEIDDHYDEHSGKKIPDVICGGALTNRPFLKDMDAIELAEVSRKSWGSVNKSQLPRACFLVKGDPDDKSTWKLPIYEGAGPVDADGHYTQRGALNINAVRAALAAIGGARQSGPMRGVPAGTRDRLTALLAHANGGNNSNSNNSQNSEQGNDLSEGGGRSGMARTSSKTASQKAKGAADDEDEQDLDDTTDGSDGMSSDDEAYAELDDGGSGDDGDEADEADGSDGEDETVGPPANPTAKRKAGRAGSKAATAKGSKGMSETEARTLSEANVLLAEQARQLREVKLQLHEAEVEKVLSGWDHGEYQFSETQSKTKNPASGKPVARAGKVAIAPRVREQIKEWMLSESAFEMPRDERQTVLHLFEQLASSAMVDLSQRGSSYTTEEKSLTAGGTSKPRTPEEADNMLAEAMTAVAAERGKELSELRKVVSAANGNRVEQYKAQQEIEAIMGIAADRIEYAGIR